MNQAIIQPAKLEGDVWPAETVFPDRPDAVYPRMLGPKYPQHQDSPTLEGQDFAGLAAGILITLGPLAAYALGFGL